MAKKRRHRLAVQTLKNPDKTVSNVCSGTVGASRSLCSKIGHRQGPNTNVANGLGNPAAFLNRSRRSLVRSLVHWGGSREGEIRNGTRRRRDWREREELPGLDSDLGGEGGGRGCGGWVGVRGVQKVCVCVCAGRVGVGMLPISISPELLGHLGSSMIDQTGGFNQGVWGCWD